jgi:hypothetical protein
MRLPIQWSFIKYLAIAILLVSGSSLKAQTAADQSFKTIPQQVKDNAENKATAKTNTVSDKAMNKLDSASGKALKGFTNLFKKKNKKAAADSTRLHATDSLRLHATDTIVVPPRSSSFTIPSIGITSLSKSV